MTRIAAQLALAMLLPLLAMLASFRMAWAAFTAPERAWDIARGMDDLLNVVTNGKPRQWVSTRAAQARNEGRRWGCMLCRLLDSVDPGHCDRIPK